MVRPGARPHLLVFNQYYWPGVEATAHLLTELCEELAHDYDVTVITGRLLGHESDPEYDRRNGVEILRVRSTAYDRAPLHRRAANYGTYLTGALRRGLTRRRRPDAVLCMTDPPMLGDVALAVARRFRAPLVVVSQDVFPEVAVELERLTNDALVALLRVLTRFYLRRADRVVAIGDTMRRRLELKGTPHERLAVIPNWVDVSAITPQPRDNAWSREHDLVGRFVVMHSGNVGHAQDLDSLVRATTFLRDLEDLRVVVVGFGARYDETIGLAQRLEADAVRFLPYQPREVLPLSLSSADLHFVGLGRGLSGYVVPSRVYGILATARPLLVAADAESETAQLVEAAGCGVVVPPGRPELVAGAVRDLLERRHELEAMCGRGRASATANADRAVAVDRYRDLLGSLVPPVRSPR